jgi:hypothetical protein
MIGFLLMGSVLVLVLYLIVAKVIPAMTFQYRGGGEREGRAEYRRIKRESPGSSDAMITEPEFVERFVGQGPRPGKYVLAAALLVLLGIPSSCAIGMAQFLK